MNSDQAAKVISLITSPFLTIPFFGLLVVAFYAHSFIEFLSWYSLFVALTVGLPLGYILWAVKAGKITDIHVMVRGQRLEPFLLASTGALLLSVLYKVMGAPDELFAMAIVQFITGWNFMIISRYWKVSVHAASYAGGVLTVAILVNWWYVVLGILLPVIVWARLKRRRHTIWQALAAIVLVSACVLGILSLFVGMQQWQEHP